MDISLDRLMENTHGDMILVILTTLLVLSLRSYQHYYIKYVIFNTSN